MSPDFYDYERECDKIDEEHNKVRYCKVCKRKTNYIRCGFGEVGGLVGNARYRCLYCRSEE